MLNKTNNIHYNMYYILQIYFLLLFFKINGTLFPRKSSLTQTLCSRLVELWIHISKSRTKFETQPDTGKFGFF